MGIYSSEIVTLTPEKAQEWLDHYAFDGQRKMRSRHIDYLVNEMKHNRFEVDQIVLCDLNGKSFLTDGQHRLAAVAALGEPAEFNLLRRKCKTLSEVEADYRRRDRGLTRTTQDCYASARSIAELPFSSGQMNGVSGAFALMKPGFVSRRYDDLTAKSSDVRVQFMQDWSKEATAFFEQQKTATRVMQGILQRSPVVAVALITFRYQEQAAIEFWRTIAEDDGLRQGQPEKTLLDWLRSNPVKFHVPHIYARYVAAAWNAKWEERDLKVLRAQVSWNPIEIKGTPYNGKEVITLSYE